MIKRANLQFMNIALQKPWTQERFFRWAEAQDVRYEFDGLRPVAMTGGNAGHSIITVHLLAALSTRWRGGPCRPIGPDAGVETVNKAVRDPDALVTCSKVDTGLAQNGILRMPEIGIEIPVAEIYQNITFPDQPDSPV